MCWLLRPREWWRSIVINSVCLCLSVSVYVCLSVRQDISGATRATFSLPNFCARCLWPCIGPPPTGWRNPKGKGQFWGFSSPLTMHCNAFVANNVMQQQNGPFRRCRGWCEWTARAKCDLRLPYVVLSALVLQCRRFLCVAYSCLTIFVRFLGPYTWLTGCSFA